MSVSLTLGSLAFGLLSWVIPIAAIRRPHKTGALYRSSVLSFTLCALSVVLQLFEIRRRVGLQDWSALMDTIDATCRAAVLLVAITAALNFLALMIHKEEVRSETA